MRRSPALGHVLVQVALYPPVEGYLLLIKPIARELDFNKKESILSVYNEKVWGLRL
jgi:hypothetical protein